MSSDPLICLEALNLQQLGVPETSIERGKTTMESDKFIVCCEEGQVTMIDLRGGGQVTRLTIAVDAAIMNPEQSILALRSNTMLQFFNLESNQILKSWNMKKPLVFWKWTSASILSMVTADVVYHWPLEGSGPPVEIFDRHPSLLGPNVQIIDYRVSADGKYCLLGGIVARNNGVNGRMQLFHMGKQMYVTLHGHAGAFAAIKIPGREDPAQIIVVHEKIAENPAELSKLFIHEIGRNPLKGSPFRVRPLVIPDMVHVQKHDTGDFRVSLCIPGKDDIAYLITKSGYVFIFDLHTGKCFYRGQFTNERIFVCCPQDSTGAICGITVRTGKVLRLRLNYQNVVPHIIQTLRDKDLALKMADRLNLPGAGLLL